MESADLSIWKTLETHCWASGFQYEADYLDLHRRSGMTSSPLNKAGYEAFCSAMDVNYEEDEKISIAKEETT